MKKLMKAIVAGIQPEQLRKQLADHPGLISMADDKGQTLLHVAAQLGRAALIPVLLEAAPAAAINMKNSLGQTPLIIALAPDMGVAMFGAFMGVLTDIMVPLEKALAAKLEQEFSTVGRPTVDLGSSLLKGMAPAKGEQIDTVQALLAAPGIDLAAVSARGWAALDYACSRGWAFCLAAILGAGLLQQQPDCVNTAKKEANVNWSRPKLPLQLAIEARSPACVQLLLRAGADPNGHPGVALDETALYPLQCVASLYLPHEKKKEPADTPAGAAAGAAAAGAAPLSDREQAEAAQVAILKLLLAAGANPTLSTPFPRGSATCTQLPVELAVLHGNLKVVEALLEGVGAGTPQEAGEQSSGGGAGAGAGATAAAPPTAGSADQIQTRHALQAAVDRANLPALQLALAAAQRCGLSINHPAQAPRGEGSLLHKAVRKSWVEGVQALLAAGADPNAEQAPNSYVFHTPALAAAAEGNLAILQALHAAHADFKKPYSVGYAMHAAFAGCLPTSVRFFCQELKQPLLPFPGLAESFKAAGHNPFFMELNPFFAFAKIGPRVFQSEEQALTYLDTLLEIAWEQHKEKASSPQEGQGEEEEAAAKAAFTRQLLDQPLVSTCSHNGRAAVHLAPYSGIMKGSIHCLKALAARGANLAVRGRDGETVLHNAARNDPGKPPAPPKQKAGEEPEPAVDPLTYSPMVAYLLEQGLSPLTLDDAGDSPFHIACKAGRGPTMRVLLAAGADPHFCAKKDAAKSPLGCLLDKSDWKEPEFKELLQILLDAGVDLHAPCTGKGHSPFYQAVLAGQEFVLAALHAAGADPRQLSTTTEESCLFAACTHGSWSKSRALMPLLLKEEEKKEEQVPPPQEEEKEQAGAAAAAAGAGSEASAAAPAPAAAPAAAPAPAGYGMGTAAFLALQRKPDGWTVLHMAVNNPEAAKDCLPLLLKVQGVNLNVQGTAGETALHVAVAKRLADAVKALLEAGADCDIENDQYQRPVDIVRQLSPDAQKTMLALFEAKMGPVTMRTLGWRPAAAAAAPAPAAAKAVAPAPAVAKPAAPAPAPAAAGGAEAQPHPLAARSETRIGGAPQQKEKGKKDCTIM